MEWRWLTQLSYENIPFKTLMHGPTLHSDVESTYKNRAILDNLMLEQEDAHIARGLGNTSTDMVDDRVIAPTPPSGPSRPLHGRGIPSTSFQAREVTGENRRNNV